MLIRGSKDLTFLVVGSRRRSFWGSTILRSGRKIETIFLGSRILRFFFFFVRSRDGDPFFISDLTSVRKIERDNIDDVFGSRILRSIRKIEAVSMIFWGLRSYVLFVRLR